jgi:eukaryotic-like serine/threonine-protein kinase
MPNRDLTKVESVFHAILELSHDDREAYLKQACQGDNSLYAEISSLVSAFDSREGFIDGPALNLGLQLLSKSSELSLIGKSTGNYTVISRLGKGGMGEVFLAEDTKLGRKVALKFLSPEFVGDNWAKRQLVKEAQAVAMLDHPNICPVYGIEEFDEHLFIVMQYIEGETLAELIRKKVLRSDQLVPLSRKIVGALAEAHLHGIIHRDMKPKNIMVTPSQQIKVLDFGLAKTMRPAKGASTIDDSVSHLSQKGLLAGTVAYMSPEQLRGERLDYRTDIFSLGTVLYEMISGRNPFARSSEAETISAILTAEVVNNGHNPDAEPLAKIALKCLNKDREDRYHSASDLLLEFDDELQVGKVEDRSSITKIVALVAAVIVVMAIFMYVGVRQFTKSPADAPLTSAPVQNRISIAILPVGYADGDGRDDYLTQGLTLSLINRFSSISEWRVVPQTAVAVYPNNLQNPLQAGRDLYADAILVGKLSQNGEEFELETNLIKTADGAQLWTGRNHFTWGTIFQLQDDLASRVSSRIGVRYQPESPNHGTRNAEAYKDYYRGRYYWNNRTEENIRRAIEAFNAAIDLDPAYAPAWAGLANSYVLLSSVGFGKTPTEEAMQKALVAAKEALTLDPNSAEAHTSLGIVEMRYRWDWNRAEEELTKALQLAPDYAPAHYWYSHLLLITSRPEAAVAEGELSRVLDPSPHSTMNFCRVLSLSRQYEKAVACYDKLISEKPDYYHAIYLRALVYLRSGRENEALRGFQLVYSKDQALAGAALGYAYGKAGRLNDAEHILQEMTVLNKKRYLPPMEFAIINIGMGNKDKAFEWLERAYEERFAHLPYIHLDPIYSTLHSDPRYLSLLSRMNLTPRAQ